MPKLSAEALKARIAKLQKQLLEAENTKAPAVKKIKMLMKKFGVTIKDLTDEATTASAKSGKRGRPRKNPSEKPSKAASKRQVAVKYRDEKGNTWTGRGKTPRWLVEAEKSGKTREAFRV